MDGKEQLGFHSIRDLLNVTLVMSRKILEVQKNSRHKCYEIDDLAEHARQIINEIGRRGI
jgi:hypothetical protein